MFGDMIYVNGIPCFKIERPGIVRIFNFPKNKETPNQSVLTLPKKY